MRTVLHVLTRPADQMAKEIATRQRESGGYKIETVDLTLKVTDYGLLLEKLFAADSIEIW